MNNERDRNSPNTGHRPKPGDPRRQRGVPVFVMVMGALLLLLVGMAFFNNTSGQDELKASELKEKLAAHEVKSLDLKIRGDRGVVEVQGEYVAPAEGEAKTFKSQISTADWEQWSAQADEDKENSLLTGVAYSIDEHKDNLAWFLMNIVPLLLIVAVIWFLFFRRAGGPMGGGVMSFGKSRAKMFSKEDITVTFSDVAGADEAKEEVAEIVEFLRNPQRFTRLGAKIPKGVLMIGPPGCGKTLLAKAIAGEADRPFYSISGSDFVEMFVGVGASRVRDLFRNARDHAPCIVFIDEIDAVGRRRGAGVGGGHDEREQTLNAILVEMDGIGSSEGVIILAATNRADVLDNALMRPGRFDRQVVIDLPDVKGREDILRVHLKNVKAAHEIDPAEIAKLTPGFSGADIMNLVNEAALIAVVRNLDAVTRECLLEARDRVRFGRQKRSRVMDEEERRLTAYHEAGHALVQEMTENTDRVHKVTIIPRGQALGATMSLPDKDRHSLSQKRAEEMLMVLLGGRAAEEDVLGEVSAGAASDIQHATEIARRMITEWGMSPKMGLVNYAADEEQEFYGQTMIAKPAKHSDETAQNIDGEIKRLIDEAYVKTRKMISDNRDTLDRIGEALLKYETIDHDDLVLLLDGGDLDEKRRKDESEAARERAARKHRELDQLTSDRPASGEVSGFAGQPGPA
ncbi:MAG: ATP-dependent zinc metalloprotease FtsH [Nitrospira sp.]|nr:ATP-dependent zinc metalloprotease FtsH [Nitrospira sp.]